MSILEFQTLVVNTVATGLLLGFFIGAILLFFGKRDKNRS